MKLGLSLKLVLLSHPASQDGGIVVEVFGLKVRDLTAFGSFFVKSE